jgi:hypothetical protein
MTWPRLLLISFFLFALPRPTASTPPQLPNAVSMVQLVATPEKFDGAVVLVVGFCGSNLKVIAYTYIGKITSTQLRKTGCGSSEIQS